MQPVQDANIKQDKEKVVSVHSAKMIREKLQLSQSAFADLLGVSIRTLQGWEQGRREPQGPAIALLRIADQHPEVFLDLK